MHYVICFDEEIGGYDRYEYSASNMIGTERYYGDRYLVLFNNDIDKSELIQKEDIFIDNVIFIVLVVLIFLLRKKIYLWLTNLEKKMNSFIIYQ